MIKHVHGISTHCRTITTIKGVNALLKGKRIDCYPQDCFLRVSVTKQDTIYIATQYLDSNTRTMTIKTYEDVAHISFSSDIK